MATILLIEDDPFFVDLLRLHLVAAGYTVEVAKDPEEGLRSILEGAPDLILLDLDLPYLSGIEVLEALRSDPATREIPLVIVTGHTDEETYNRCAKIGFDGFFAKPLVSDKLFKAIADTLAERAK